MQWRIDSFDWTNHEPVDLAVLCFIRTDGALLLIHKQRGLGKGKINGPGGRVEPGETSMEAAVRETQEEVGLTPSELHHAGELSFVFTDGYSLQCSVITAGKFHGQPQQTEEAIPFWCAEQEIPFEKMWEDDRLWMPLMLAGTPFRGFFIFDEDRMVDHRLYTGTEAELTPNDLRGRSTIRSGSDLPHGQE